MSDLVAFLRARLDEDERVARPEDLDEIGPEDTSELEDEYKFGCLVITKRRVLDDIESKRRILRLHECSTTPVDQPSYDPVTGTPVPAEYQVECVICGWVSDIAGSACETVRLLAVPYADRPGYREEWRP